MAQMKVERPLAHSSIGHVGIPPLVGFCSKFYLFFAALGCGAYLLAPVGVVTRIIGGVEPREALLRGRSLAPLHSLQGSKLFFNIEESEVGDPYDGKLSPALPHQASQRIVNRCAPLLAQNNPVYGRSLGTKRRNIKNLIWKREICLSSDGSLTCIDQKSQANPDDWSSALTLPDDHVAPEAFLEEYANPTVVSIPHWSCDFSPRNLNTHIEWLKRLVSLGEEAKDQDAQLKALVHYLEVVINFIHPSVAPQLGLDAGHSAPLEMNFDFSLLGPCITDRAMCSVKRTLKVVTWSPPPSGFVKANVDGSMDKWWSKGGIDGMIRDEK
ncbi:Detected protein of unknown function [Hibiscus syriacus]|uniref:Uncharacterized protein n=1 Tax=Hibiscus syriacus TaxID=106335 RepID=A0A6A2Y4X0_HIBSY|nr:Detected protein of unknown function [Hibiscus syriacus]